MSDQRVSITRLGRVSRGSSPSWNWSLWFENPSAGLPPGSWREALDNGVTPSVVLRLGQGSRKRGLQKMSKYFRVSPDMFLLANANTDEPPFL